MMRGQQTAAVALEGALGALPAASTTEGPQPFAYLYVTKEPSYGGALAMHKAKVPFEVLHVLSALRTHALRLWRIVGPYIPT